MRLHQKLLLGFALVALLVGCVGYVAQTMNAHVAYSVLRLSESVVPEAEHAAAMAAALDVSRDAVRTLTRPASGPADSTAAQALERALTDFEKHLVEARAATLRGRARAEEERHPDDLDEAEERLRTLTALRWAFEEYRQVARRAVDPDAVEPDAVDPEADDGLLADRSRLPAVADSLARAVLAPSLASYRLRASEMVAEETEAARDRLTQADRLLFGAVLLAIGLTLILGILIAHQIARPLLALTDAARTVGQGRLDVRLNLQPDGELGELVSTFNAMTEELSHTTVSRRYLSTIIHSMADPLLVTSAAGTVEMANEASAAIIGLEVEEVVGQPLDRFLADTEALLADVGEAGFGVGREATLLTAEGGRVPVALSAAAMHEGGAPGVVWVAKDVTQQKRAEAKLREARDAAEEVARLKSNFLANMSHEIRTPLNGIIGSAQVLRAEAESREAAGGAGEAGERREVAGIIERSAVRLLGTINSVLDMARLEAGGLRPHAEAVRLADEAADALGILEVLAEGKGLALRLDEQAGDVWAAVDPSCFHRVVYNLVGNAIKFTQTGSVTVEIDADGAEAVVRVRDTGIGVDTRFLPRLFEEFQQESTGLGRSHEGTGLGLAITKRLVHLMGGSIGVHSAKGTGSVFTVRLPRIVPAESEGSAEFEGAPAAVREAVSE